MLNQLRLSEACTRGSRYAPFCVTKLIRGTRWLRPQPTSSSRSSDWGVDTIFGLPGDGINGIMEALRKRQDKIRFIQVRHEEAAAFMACAYAKFTGKLGVCLATSGPGGIHLLNGLYDAKLDGQPVLAITGHALSRPDRHLTQQDVDLDKLFMDVAVYNARVMGPTHVENVADLACRTALQLSRRRPHQLSRRLPGAGDQERAVEAQRAAPHVGRCAPQRAACPTTRICAQAAEMLNAGKQGRDPGRPRRAGRDRRAGADWPRCSARRSSRRCSARRRCPTTARTRPAASACSARSPSQEAMESCDTLLMVGTSFPYIEFLPKPGQARGVQIDLDPTRIGLRYPVEVGLVGDSRRTLQALLPLLQRNDGPQLPREGADRDGGVAEADGRTRRRARTSR